MLVAIDPITGPTTGIGIIACPKHAPKAAPVASIALNIAKLIKSSSSSFPTL